MNLLRVRIDYSDILTLMMRQRFITVVVRSMWYRHRRLSTVKGCHVMVRQVIRGQLTHSQMHNAHTVHALEDIRESF